MCSDQFKSVLWLLALALSALLACRAPAAETDPLLGKWLGSIGTDRERVEVGLEFRLDQQGKLQLRLTQPIANYFDVDPGGELVRQGDGVKLASLALELRLQGDRLLGTFPGPASRAELRRTDALPQALQPPLVPTGPGPQWQTRLGGQIYASPVVGDDIVYVGTTGGVMNAIEVNSGEIRWTYSAGGPIFASVALDKAALYLVSDRGWLIKLHSTDGKEVWRYPLGDQDVQRILPHPSVFDWDWQAAAPLVAEQSVFVGGGDGRLHSVDVETGKANWRFSSGDKIRQSAAVDQDGVYFGSHDGKLYALDRASGAERWRFDSGAAIDSVPLLHAGKVLIGNRGSGLISLNAGSGELDWRLYFWGSWVESTPIVVDDILYIGSSDLRRVSAINPANGHVQWRSDVYGWSWGTPLVLGEQIYAGVAGGEPYFIKHVASFTVLDRRTGEMLQRWPLPDTGAHQWGISGSPVVAGDRIIVATIDGSLLAFPRFSPDQTAMPIDP